MITFENYKNLSREYKIKKQLAIDSGMNAEQFLTEINLKTEFGKIFIDFFKKISDGGDIEQAVKDFVEIVYHEKVINRKKNTKKTKK